jgi:hypothetical protein
MFIAIPFTITKLWKQSRCPTTDKQIKKMWYIYTMKYYSAIRRMKLCFMQVNGTGDDVKLSQAQKGKGHFFPSHVKDKSKR